MSREEVLPMFQSKTIEFEYRSDKKASPMSEQVAGLIGIGLFLVVFIAVVFSTMFIISVIPGAMDFFGGDEFQFPQLILVGVTFLSSFLIVRPIIMRLDERFENRRWEAQKKDEKRFAEKLKEQGFISNLPISMKNVSRNVLTEESTGIDYRIMGYSQGYYKGSNKVRISLRSY